MKVLVILLGQMFLGRHEAHLDLLDRGHVGLVALLQALLELVVLFACILELPLQKLFVEGTEALRDHCG